MGCVLMRRRALFRGRGFESRRDLGVFAASIGEFLIHVNALEVPGLCTLESMLTKSVQKSITAVVGIRTSTLRGHGGTESGRGGGYRSQQQLEVMVC